MGLEAVLPGPQNALYVMLLNLLTGQKSGFFRPAGATRCTDSGQTLQGRRAPGSAWLCKISPQSTQGVGMRPQNVKKIALFGKESSRRGDSLDRFLKFYGLLYV